MKVLGAVVLTLLLLLPVRWQPGRTATNDPKAETVVDANGTLRPAIIAPPTRLLGSWAVAADQGQGAKEIHVVYASPRTGGVAGVSAESSLLREEPHVLQDSSDSHRLCGLHRLGGCNIRGIAC